MPAWLADLAKYALEAGQAALPGAVKKTVGGMSSALLGSLTREDTYASNKLGWTMIPEIPDLLKLWWGGRLGPDDMKSFMDAMAVYWSVAPQNMNERDRAWQNLVEMSRPMLELGRYQELWRREIITDTEFLGALAREGYSTKLGEVPGSGDNERNVQLITNYSEWVGVADILLLYWSGMLGDDPEKEVRRLLRAAGYTDTSQQDFLLKVGLPYTATEALVLLNRGVIDEPRADRMMAWAGLHDEQVRSEVKNLRYEIPGPSDLVRFAVRHVFEPDLVKKFGFNDEVNPDFLAWHEKQGFGQKFDIHHPTLGDWKDATWAQAHWWAHWVWPSPDMAFRMFQRFRPPEPGDINPRDPSGLVFTEDDLNYLLRGNDYPPHWRPYLANLAYRPLDVRSVRWGRQFDIFDEDESRRRYQDMGYAPESAVLLSQIDTARFADRDNAWIRSEEQSIKKRALKCTLDAYDTGVIGADDARGSLAALGLPDALQQMELGVHDLCFQVGVAKQAIKDVRAQYLKGWIDSGEAENRLRALGITPEAIDQYATLWAVQLTPRRKQLSTEHVLKELTGGFITRADAISFLTNLGWADPELTILIADSARATIQAQAKAAAAEQKARTARAKEIAAAAKQAKVTYDQLLAELRRVEPITLLTELAKKGIISREEFIARLTDHGIPARAQAYYLDKAYAETQQPGGTAGATAGQPGSGP